MRLPDGSSPPVKYMRALGRWALGLLMILSALGGFNEVSYSLVVYQTIEFVSPSGIAVGAVISALSLFAGCLLLASSRHALPVAALALVPQALGFAAGPISYAMMVGMAWTFEMMVGCHDFVCGWEGYSYSPLAGKNEFQLRTDRGLSGSAGVLLNFAALTQLAWAFAVAPARRPPAANSRPGPTHVSIAP